MAKLNQIIAVQAGKKAKAKETLTEAYHQIKKPDLLSGLVRTYQPRDEGGEPQPEERKFVQVKVNDLIAKVTRELTRCSSGRDPGLGQLPARRTSSSRAGGCSKGCR